MVGDAAQAGILIPMQATDAMIELAERRVAMEAAAGVARVQARLVCDCGEPISEARRRAVPHTDKCVDCAMMGERRSFDRLRRRA